VTRSCFFFFLLSSIGSKLGVDCGLVRLLAGALAYQLLTSLVVGIQATYRFAGKISVLEDLIRHKFVITYLSFFLMCNMATTTIKREPIGHRNGPYTENSSE
jgi:hypothetical protein